MSRRWWAARAVAGLAVLALAACGSTGAAPVEHRGEIREVSLGALDATAVAAAETAFGLDLLHAVCAGRPGENLLLSPTSVAQALALLYPAAGGGTGVAMGALLHLPPWSPDIVAALQQRTAALAELAYDGDLDDDDAPDSLRLSNRVWTDLDIEPDPAYLDDIATALRAGVQSVDFAGDPAGATDRINESVARDTAGLIDPLLDAPVQPSTVVVLTNALHLQARWSVPFTDTSDAPFAAPDGDVTVDLMTGARGEGRSAGGWQQVELAYRDGTLTTLAVLPPPGTDPCALDGPALEALAGAEPSEVEVALPRLDVEQTHQMLDVLAGLGLPVEGDYAALGREGLAVTAVVHKALLRVDEAGTVAAAATGVVIEESAAAPVELVSFDRPFLLLLTDTATGSPLFVAVVTDPTR